MSIAAKILFISPSAVSHALKRLRSVTGWIAEKTDQEMFGDPQFLLEPKEANKKAFNDRVIDPGSYTNNPYVMRVLNSRTIETNAKKVDKI